MSSENYTPSKVQPRMKGYQNTLSMQMGIIDYDQGWDNEYSKFRAIAKLVENTMMTVKNGRSIKVPKDLEFNWDAINSFDRIWSGGCVRVIVRQPEERRFLLCENPQTSNPYFESTKKFLETLEKDRLDIDELIWLPKYRRLVPLGKIDEKRWGVQTRISWPTKYAWEGISWATITQDANFQIWTNEGLIPKVAKENYLSAIDRTWVYAKDNFFAITDDYDIYLNKKWAIIQDDFQYLIDHNDDVDSFSFLEKIGMVEHKQEGEDENPYAIDIDEKIKELQDTTGLDLD